MQLKKIYNFSLIQLIVFVAIAIGVGAIVTVLVTNRANSQLREFIDATHPVRVNNSQYKFIKPLLAYEQPEGSEFTVYKPLETELNNYIQQSKSNKKISDISVYIRSLKNGRRVGINENINYSPASLMKVPLMIAYLKESENDPNLLEKELLFTQDSNISAKIPFNDPTKLIYGQRYKVIDLIKSMIVDSDNGAMDILLQTVDQNSLSETYTDLGIPDPDSTDGSYNISPKTYSLFFRILYNSTYLNTKNSELALQILSEVKFKDGLQLNLPQNIQISHKYGEHITTDEENYQTGAELHDCGIIYKENNPYIICVMTKGENINDLKKIIQDISLTVYNKIK